MRTVLDSNFDIIRVKNTLSIMSPTRRRALHRECSPPDPAKNMVIIAISVGNRPLQGTKLLVKMAISRSRGDSMIRQPITPQALHPNPIQIDNINL